MKQKGFGTHLVQGWTANAIVTYVLMLGVLLWKGTREIAVIYLIVGAIYPFITGALGAFVGGGIWLAGFLIERQLRILWRALVGVLLPIGLAVLLGLAFDFIRDLKTLGGAALSLLILNLPAALMAGSRLNPLRSVIFGLDQLTFRSPFGRAFSFPPALLLRVGSIFGLLEALLYLACLPSSALANWGTTDRDFAAAMVAVAYFTVTAIVSLSLPQKRIVTIVGLLVNTPLVIWAIDSQRYVATTSRLLAFVVWIFVFLWVLFAVGRLVFVIEALRRPLRILPVTMLEIRIRHALNYW